MCKRFFIVFLGVVLFFSGSLVTAQPSLNRASADSTTATSSFSKGLLWRVTKPGANPSFLFGTMHSDDARVIAVFDRLQSILVAVDGVAIEMELTPENTVLLAQAMFFTDGRSLGSVVGDELLRKTVAAAKHYGLPPELVAKFKPWAIASVLSMPQQQSETFMDKRLYEQAQKLGKHVYGLETAQEQISVFDGLTMSEQAVLLSEAVDSMDLMPKIHEEVAQAYLSEDLLEMQAIYEKYMTGTDTQLEKKLHARLLQTRNRLMVERMQPLLDKHRMLVAIGALHLPGEHGLLQLLRERGFHVERAID